VLHESVVLPAVGNTAHSGNNRRRQRTCRCGHMWL
jgi:hypothetical protein